MSDPFANAAHRSRIKAEAEAEKQAKDAANVERAKRLASKPAQPMIKPYEPKKWGSL